MKMTTSSLLRLCESQASSSSGGVAGPPAPALPPAPAVRDVEEPGVFGAIKGRARRFTTYLDSVMVLIVLCVVAFTYGKAVGVLCFSFVLFTLMAREFERI